MYNHPDIDFIPYYKFRGARGKEGGKGLKFKIDLLVGVHDGESLERILDSDCSSGVGHCGIPAIMQDDSWGVSKMLSTLH